MSGGDGITICVCTYRRPHLDRTLSSLAALEIEPGLSVDIVVADNDESDSARARVDAFRAVSPFAVTYVHAPASNICIARNACLDAAPGRYCAFIDDDEEATPGWLLGLLAEMRRDGAAAVLGPVRSVYAAEAPAWMRDGEFHATRPVWVRGEIVTGYTCNALIDRSHPGVAGLRFDPRLGRSGGEDTAFFGRIHGAGGRIAFAPDALVVEPVPPARARFAWLAERRFRMGHTHGHLQAAERGVAARAPRMLLAFAKAAACLALAGATLPSPVASRRHLLRSVLHAGAIGGLAGTKAIEPYGRPEAPDALGDRRAA